MLRPFELCTMARGWRLLFVIPALITIIQSSEMGGFPTALGGGYVNNFGGTSAACPYAAGVGACMQSAAKSSTGFFLLPDQVKSKLVASGDPIIYESAGLTKPMVNLGAIDIDDDGKDADWEITYFSDLSHDGTGDADADSLTDLQEYQYATDPVNPDTDGD